MSTSSPPPTTPPTPAGLQDQPGRPAFNTANLGQRLLRLSPIRRRPQPITRRFTRHDCLLPAVASLDVQKFDLNGVILDVSQQGALFRPASMFLLSIQNEPITLHVAGHDIESLIANTTKRGYGLRFAQIQDEAIIADVTAASARFVADNAINA